MANESHNQEHATVGQVRAIIRRKLRRQVPPEENFLNIYPMMDMMTILLVFMIMQFANSSASITSTEELQLPYSTSVVEMGEAIAVEISRNEIVIDGEHVLDLRNGQVDPSHKQGGGTGFLIMPMFDVMQRQRDRSKLIAQNNPNRPFLGQIQIIADRRTPFRTLAEVVYTLGQTEYKTLHFVVRKQSGS